MGPPVLVHPATTDGPKFFEAHFVSRVLVVWVYCFKIDEDALPSPCTWVNRFPYAMLWNMFRLQCFFCL